MIFDDIWWWVSILRLALENRAQDTCRKESWGSFENPTAKAGTEFASRKSLQKTPRALNSQAGRMHCCRFSALGSLPLETVLKGIGDIFTLEDKTQWQVIYYSVESMLHKISVHSPKPVVLGHQASWVTRKSTCWASSRIRMQSPI